MRSAMMRRNGQLAEDYVVREDDVFPDMKQALLRVREGRSRKPVRIPEDNTRKTKDGE